MARCDRCGCDAEATFQLAIGAKTFTFDSFECALEEHDAISKSDFHVRAPLPATVKAANTRPRAIVHRPPSREQGLQLTP